MTPFDETAVFVKVDKLRDRIARLHARLMVNIGLLRSSTAT